MGAGVSKPLVARSKNGKELIGSRSQSFRPIGLCDER
jgi:hypothetical protein